jgi:phospholipid/cholesterol/gamma-HCH transport system ATP-binding protein
MRRFKLGGSGRGNDDEGSAALAGSGSGQAPEASSVPPPGSSPGSQGGSASPWEPASGSSPSPSAPESSPSPPADSGSWLPRDQEGWQSPSDEPAPIRSEREHGLEGAQTPESDVAHPESSSQQPESADAQSGGGGQGEPRDGQRDQPQEDGQSERQRGASMPWDSSSETRSESSSRVSVVDEQPPRPTPPPGASEEEYKWHSYRVYPSGRPDGVEFIDVYKAFGRNRILRGLNMGLPEGMVSMIIGPSGTGKSVCIKHMVGLLYPDEGDVLVHGESVPNMPDDDLFEMRKKFGLLFQDGALFGSMNLYDNVAFPLRQHTEKSEDEVEDIVMRRLNEVGLGSAREKMPNELSGGMRKRAGFARALVLEPDIVLFDEPDSGLDPVRTALLGELILEIHRDMMDEAKEKQKERLPTFAVITHDIMSARRVADYINVLWKGRIVEAGPAEDMLNSENPFIRQFLAGESQGPLTMD